MFLCQQKVVQHGLCSRSTLPPDTGLLSISLRSFYLPREFPQLFFTLVYIHPRADASRAIEQNTGNIHKLDSISPDAPKFILGDFNHCSLNTTLKTYHQYVTCPTRFNKTIDLCFVTVPGVYTSLALPPLGSADHNSVLPAPVYKPVIQRVQRVVKTVKDWTEDSIACLQGCFDCTDWEMIDQMCTSFNELTDVISSYISFCVESVIPSKHITIFPNNKPWVTKDLKGALNKKKWVFFQGTTDEKKQVNREVWGGGGGGAIRKAKEKYRKKIESKFSGGCLRAAWQGIKNMAAVNKVSAPRGSRVSLQGVADEALPTHINSFFTRFETRFFITHFRCEAVLDAGRQCCY